MCATTATNAPSCRKNTLVFFGSPHQSGVTSTLLTRFLEAAPADAVDRIDCFARGVLPCDDCRGCFATNRCVKRDMDDIYTLLEDADRLLFVTPVYNRSFPAPMKAMLDRFQCYWAARFIGGIRPPIAKPKTAWLLTVSGSDREDGALLETQLAPLLTVLNARFAGGIHLKNADRTVDWQAVDRKLQALCAQGE